MSKFTEPNLLRHKPPFGILLVAGTTFLSLLVLGFGYFSLNVSREYAIRDARIDTQNIAESIGQNIQATIQRIDHTLITAAITMERNLKEGSLNAPRMIQFLTTEEKLLPEVVALRITNANGNVILGNPTGDLNVSLSDRPFFPYLRDHPDAGLFVSEPILGAFTKQWVITCARRYNLPDGSFGGVVVAPVFVEHFQSALSKLQIGPGGSLSLRDIHGGLVAHIPVVVKGRTLAIGDRTISHELSEILKSGVSQQTYFALVPFDQTRRTLTFLRIAGAPLFVIASLAESDYLAQWHRDCFLTYMLISVFLLVVWAMVAAGWWLWKRRESDAEALQQSAAWIQSLLRLAMDGFWVTDLQGRLLEVNETYCRMCGYSAQELLAMSVPDLEASENAAETAAHLQKVIELGEDRFESRHRHKDGTIFDVEISVQFRQVEGGRMVAFLRNITERKQVELALKQREIDLQDRNDELTRFTYTVSHDLKTPLVTISTFLGYLEMDLHKPDPADLLKDVGFIRNAAEKMSRLLDELLELSRVGRQRNLPVEIPLLTVVNEALALVAGRIKMRGVSVEVTASSVILHGDHVRLVEIFQNLLDNACKFMGDQPAPQVEIGMEEEQGECVIFVRDNGIGIDPRHHSKLFGLFEKLAPDTSGTGIGLALVKRIVEVHGGRIWIESRGIGKGTTVRFTLPQSHEKQQA